MTPKRPICANSGVWQRRRKSPQGGSCGKFGLPALAWPLLSLPFFYTRRSILQTQTALHSDRAWITSSGFGAHPQSNGDVAITIRLVNSGRTPADDVRICSDIRTVPFGTQFLFPPCGLNHLPVWGPDVTTEFIVAGNRTFTVAEVKEARDQKIHLLAHCTLAYRDVLTETEHRPQITVEILIPRVNDNQLTDPDVMKASIQTKGWPTQNTAT